MSHIDIYSKGEVIQYLQFLLDRSKIKDCIHLGVYKRYAQAFYSKCELELASWEEANNVYTVSTGYGGPSSYQWPRCMTNCPKYRKAKNFFESLMGIGVRLAYHGAYVDKDRIEDLQCISSSEFDLKKLIEFCEELNVCHSKGAILAIPLLVRAILDHIPPIFKMSNFTEVANNYKNGSSFKKSMLNLENSLRNIADLFLHTQIRKKEALPTKTQVDFKNDLDVLLQGIVRILKS